MSAYRSRLSRPEKILRNVFRKQKSTCAAMLRIVETELKRIIYTFLSSHGVFHRSQHGFMSKRSVCTNLLQSLNDWTIYVQARDQTTVIYIDFKKAFDVVSHEKTVHQTTVL